MANYSIKDLEKLSGIKAHTIRMWEKRYGIISPQRTDTNIRYYCDSELKKLLNIAMLNNHGLKISKISKLEQDEIRKAVEQIAESDTAEDVQIDSLVVAMVDLDRRKFEKVLAMNTKRMGFEKVAINILYPFLQKVGVMWLADSINPAQEHFISSLIIQKLYVAIDSLYDPEKSPDGRKALLFLREGELHEMGLLFYRYLMKKRGFETIYLGQSVPFDDLVKTVKAHQPDILVTAFVASIDEEPLINYLKELGNTFSDQKILVSGFQVSQLSVKLPKNVSKANDVHQFVDLVEHMNA